MAALKARGLGAVALNLRITAARKLAVEAADNGLLAREPATGIASTGLGQLAQDDAEAFEDHYFECATCESRS